MCVNKIIKKDGNTTPIVAIIAPIKPACELPTNVAIFIAIGPGELSANAMKFNNSSLVIHSYINAFSLIKDIIACPPPKVKAPISKKVRNNNK